MQRRPLARTVLGVALMTPACALFPACRSGPERQVVLVTIDTLRADHVGTRRDGVQLTPALDRLAADAVRYRDVLANASTTRPSHASMLSGLYPWRHRVISNRHALPDDVPWLPDVLRAHGLRTGAVVSSIQLLGAASGMRRGFDAYHDSFDSAEANRANQLVKTPAETTSVALDWVAANRRRDFFLWVHYFPPHGPYTPPVEFVEDLPPSASTIRLPVGSGNYVEGMIPRYQRLHATDDPEVYRRLYAAHVRYVDHHVGRLLDGLRELGVYDRALVLVTSDHGESLGEHGWYFCHGNLVFQEQVAIPLLVKLPANREGGRVVTEPVEGVDLAATILRVLGLDGAMAIDGRAVPPEADGGRSRFTQSEDAELVAVVEGATKFVLRLKMPGLAGGSHPTRSVFALEADPAETSPITGEPAATVARHEAELRRNYQDIPGAALQPMSPDQEERLRSLGYVR